jgi:hypothetical protein
MKILPLSFTAIALAVVLPTAHAAPPAELCKALQGFVESVRPDDKRELAFHTSWGSNFKDAQEPALSAKRCTHNGYDPAKAVCAYLMEHGSTEFTGINVKDSISCLSRKTKFDQMFSLNGGEFSFSYGSDQRGALIDITFKEDEEIGGMVFRVVADGY